MKRIHYCRSKQQIPFHSPDICQNANPFPLEIWYKIFEIVFEGSSAEGRGSNEYNTHAERRRKINILLVCKLFYFAAIPVLYRSPQISSSNFLKFHDSIATNPSLKDLTWYIDLTNVGVGIAKNSMVSRIIRKSANSLRSFTASQGSLGMNCLRALQQCKELETCDLACVNVQVDLQQVILWLSSLPKLTTLNFPRCSIKSDSIDVKIWPQSLSHIGIAGGITDSSAKLLAMRLPQSVTSISVGHCPLLTRQGLYYIIDSVSDHLTSLSINYPMPSLSRRALDNVLQRCPHLQYLRMSTEYFTSLLFEPHMIPNDHPLSELELYATGQYMLSMVADDERLVSPDDIGLAIAEGKLGNLRKIVWNMSLWRCESQDVRDLIELIEDMHGTTEIRKY